MEYIIEIWPFVPSQQEDIFRISGFAIIGLTILNIASAIRQRLSFSKIVRGLFTRLNPVRQGMPFSKTARAYFAPIVLKNKIETIIEAILVATLILGFLVLLMDISINGMQIIDIKELNFINHK